MASPSQIGMVQCRLSRDHQFNIVTFYDSYLVMYLDLNEGCDNVNAYCLYPKFPSESQGNYDQPKGGVARRLCSGNSWPHPTIVLPAVTFFTKSMLSKYVFVTHLKGV